MSQEAGPGAPPMFREIAAITNERPRAYRSLTAYTWVLLALVALYLLGIVATFVTGVVSGLVGATAATTPLVAIVLADQAIYILCMIAGGFWIYNAACNVRALGGRGFAVSPGWAVGFYAIPVMSWFKPFEAMDEIDRASRAPESWRGQRTRIALRIWWGCWLLAGIGGAALQVFNRLGGANDLGAIEIIGVVSLGLAVANVTATILFFTIVLGIHRAQAETRARGANLAQVFA